MGIVFKPIEKVVMIEAPATEITIQELVNAIREWEDSSEGIVYDEICNASGKQTIPGGKVGITMEMINNWRIQFEPRTGPDWVMCTISGGNLVATNEYGNNPIKPSAYTFVVISQSSSPTLVYASGGSPEDIADAVWDERTNQHVAPGSFGLEVQSLATAVDLQEVKNIVTYIRRVIGNKMTWDDAHRRFCIWNDAGDEIIMYFTPKTKSGGLITMADDTIAQRTKIE